MRKILVVRSDLLKAMNQSVTDDLTTREKMIGILKERVKSATTDRERRIAEDELRVFVGIKDSASRRK